jgi:hypothetical protein
MPGSAVRLNTCKEAGLVKHLVTDGRAWNAVIHVVCGSRIAEQEAR